MKKILVGIDGGASNTKLIAVDENLNILKKSEGEAANFLKIGINDAITNISKLVKPVIDEFKTADKYLVVGTAGAGRAEDAARFQDQLINAIPGFKKIKVVSDAEITFRGAFENENGAILITGTGSILYYKFGNEINRVGGFGRLIGDEGSGYTIGRKGLNLLSKMLDARIDKTKLTELAKEKFEIDSAQKLISKVYRESFDIASFAKTIIEAAEAKEEHSLKIVNEEIEELLNHLKVLPGEKKSDKIKLVLFGGLVETDNYFKRILVQKIKNELPQIEIVNPKQKPEFGAVLMAKDILQED